MNDIEVGHRLVVTFKANRFGRITARERLHGLPLFLNGAKDAVFVGDTYKVEVVRKTAQESSYLVSPVELIKCHDGLHGFLRKYDLKFHGHLRAAFYELKSIERNFGGSRRHLSALFKRIEDPNLPRTYRLELARKHHRISSLKPGSNLPGALKVALWLARVEIAQGMHSLGLAYLTSALFRLESIHGKHNWSLIPVLEMIRDSQLALGRTGKARKTQERISQIPQPG